MGRLLNFIVQLIVLAVILFVLTAVLIAVDGATDQIQYSDVALVLTDDTALQGPTDPLLDQVIKLNRVGDFGYVLLLAPPGRERPAQANPAADYLENHGIASDNILIDRHGGDLSQIGLDVAKTMKSRHFASILVVGDYYRIFGIRMVLMHAGVTQISWSHIGRLRKEDVPEIVTETAALYQFLAKTYVIPTAEKVGEEAKVGLAKAENGAEKAKENVDKKMETLPK